MQTKLILNHETTQAILASAQAFAQEQGWSVSIAVTDDGGHLLGFLRMDGAAALSAKIAPEKALVASLARRPSAAFETMINQGRTAFLSAPLHGMLEGGEPIFMNGQCIGAIGVSGVRPEQDVEVARAGLRALA